MTNPRKNIVLSTLVAAMVLAMPMTAQADNFAAGDTYQVADTKGMDRRGDRRDDRQGCGVTEGALVQDKRSCKQDSQNG